MTVTAGAGSGASGPRVGSRSSRVQSVERAVALLRAVAEAAENAATVSALADACGLNRATAWRILTTLEAHGFVASAAESGQFRLGPALLALSRADRLEGLVRAAQPVLARLAQQTGETAALAVVRGNTLTYVEEATPAAIVTATWRGRQVPLHATSTGKALLAFTRRDLLGSAGRGTTGSALTRYTDRTITDLQALAEELSRTRERGYGVCSGEFESTAWGVSAPVLDAQDEVLAVVSIWGPEGRVTEDRFPALGVLAMESARALAGW